MIEWLIIAGAAGYLVGLAIDHWISNRKPNDWGEPDEHANGLNDIPDFLKRQAE